MLFFRRDYYRKSPKTEDGQELKEQRPVDFSTGLLEYGGPSQT